MSLARWFLSPAQQAGCGRPNRSGFAEERGPRRSAVTCPRPGRSGRAVRAGGMVAWCPAAAVALCCSSSLCLLVAFSSLFGQSVTQTRGAGASRRRFACWLLVRMRDRPVRCWSFAVDRWLCPTSPSSRPQLLISSSLQQAAGHCNGVLLGFGSPGVGRGRGCATYSLLSLHSPIVVLVSVFRCLVSVSFLPSCLSTWQLRRSAVPARAPFSSELAGARLPPRAASPRCRRARGGTHRLRLRRAHPSGCSDGPRGLEAAACTGNGGSAASCPVVLGKRADAARRRRRARRGKRGGSPALPARQDGTFRQVRGDTVMWMLQLSPCLELGLPSSSPACSCDTALHDKCPGTAQKP